LTRQIRKRPNSFDAVSMRTSPKIICVFEMNYAVAGIEIMWDKEVLALMGVRKWPIQAFCMIFI
jgi:hypothetical protein